MGGSRDRSSGRKDNKRKRRKSRSYSSSKSYEDQGQYQKNQKKNKPNNQNNMGQGSGNMQGNYMSNGNNQNMNHNNSNMNYDDGNSGGQNNMLGQGMNQQGHQGHSNQKFNQSGQGMNAFGMQRMMNTGGMMMNPNRFMIPQPPTPNLMMPTFAGMNMQMGGQFKMPAQPFMRFPAMPMGRQFPQFSKQNFLNPVQNMSMNQQMEQDDHNQGNKKVHKFNDKAQQKIKQIDSEPFVTFKNMNLISGLVEIIQNTSISLDKSNSELTFYVCKKAFHEILRKLKELNHNRYHESTDDLLKYLERQFIDEQKAALKEFNHQKSLREKNYLFNNTKFNNGIDNIDYQILKLIHKSKKLKDIFDLIQTESSNKVDLSSQNDSLARKLIIFTSNSYNDQSHKLFQESIKLFNQIPTQ